LDDDCSVKRPHQFLFYYCSGSFFLLASREELFNRYIVRLHSTRECYLCRQVLLLLHDVHVNMIVKTKKSNKLVQVDYCTNYQVGGQRKKKIKIRNKKKKSKYNATTGERSIVYQLRIMSTN
jgi:hypothetical protein